MTNQVTFLINIFIFIFQSTQPEKAQVPPSPANLNQKVSLLGDHAVQPCHGQIKTMGPIHRNIDQDL